MLGAALSGCGSDTPPPIVESDAAVEPKPPETVTLFPDAPPLPGERECKVVIRTGIPLTPARHLPVCTPVQYETNPPSGGDHWPIWAEYKSYEAPVPREIYVHSLEHGAIVLAYRCPSSGCTEVKAMLDQVRSEATSDPRCLASPGGPEARLVVTPDDALDSPVAAAAWGATYTATCLDAASLARFVADNYAKGPEDTCSNAGAVDVDDPAGDAPRCGEAAPDAGAEGGAAPEAGAEGGGPPGP
ncbi:hypothetical protein SOCE26_033370 [Sorangium cellulosum]|uniref:DUF3105 domain-containing protein n=1 Tax=Sorangium cellulosum TaxID=56 RepID=A0A2L0ERM6_SORCE|nr:hypothetical protein SOCE26_033370 [Sorangium cellulosum]